MNEKNARKLIHGFVADVACASRLLREARSYCIVILMISDKGTESYEEVQDLLVRIDDFLEPQLVLAARQDTGNRERSP